MEACSTERGENSCHTVGLSRPSNREARIDGSCTVGGGGEEEEAEDVVVDKEAVGVTLLEDDEDDEEEENRAPRLATTRRVCRVDHGLPGWRPTVRSTLVRRVVVHMMADMIVGVTELLVLVNPFWCLVIIMFRRGVSSLLVVVLSFWGRFWCSKGVDHPIRRT
jgi:hypothetical protein